MKYFVTGIGTDVGKTVVSAILAEALQADYWKPVQCGGLDYTDAQRVRNLVSNNKTRIFPETYLLKTPVSPHAAAAIENIEIDLDNLTLPETENNLIVEGAGGLMVPLNKRFLILDLIKKLNLSVILVSKNYLGSINHTLLSTEILRLNNIPIAGIIFNGIENKDSESIIKHLSGLKVFGRVEYEDVIDKGFIKRNAEKLKSIANVLQQ